MFVIVIDTPIRSISAVLGPDNNSQLKYHCSLILIFSIPPGDLMAYEWERPLEVMRKGFSKESEHFFALAFSNGKPWKTKISDISCSVSVEIPWKSVAVSAHSLKWIIFFCVYFCKLDCIQSEKKWKNSRAKHVGIKLHTSQCSVINQSFVFYCREINFCEEKRENKKKAATKKKESKSFWFGRNWRENKSKV